MNARSRARAREGEAQMMTVAAVRKALPEIAPLLTIRLKAAGLGPLVPNPMQSHFHARSGHRNIDVKSRQLGFTTWECAEGLLCTLCVPGFTGVITAAEERQAQRILRIAHLMHEQMPEGLDKVPLIHESAHQLVTPFGSSLYIGTSEGRAFGRGDTIHWALLSEFAYYPDQEGFLSNILPAIPEDGIINIESTANGIGDTFYQVYRAAREDVGGLPVAPYTPGRNGFTSFFYPWWWEVPNPHQLPLRPGERIALDEAEARVMEMARGDGFELALENIKWRRQAIARMGRKFAQEYAEDDETCFLMSGRGVFDPELLEEGRVALRQPVQTWRQDGLEFRRWKRPGHGKAYVVAFDAAEGLGRGDFDAVVVIDVERGEHVATVHGKAAPDLLGAAVYDLAMTYNEALVVGERASKGWATLTHIMTAFDYPHIYRHQDPEDLHPDPRPGWQMTKANKERIISEFENAVREGSFISYDPMLWAEARSYVRDARGRAGATQGAHDDLLTAAMIGNIVAESAAPAGFYGVKFYYR